MIEIPSIEIAKQFQQQPSFEIDENAYNDINYRRILKWLQDKITYLTNQYVGYSNAEQTREEIKAAILSQYSDIIDNLHCKKDDFDIQVKNREIDELAEKCDSYEEYKMKHAVINGDLPVISESEFWKRHDPNNKYMLDIDIQLKPLEEIQYINFNYKLSKLSAEESL